MSIDTIPTPKDPTAPHATISEKALGAANAAAVTTLAYTIHTSPTPMYLMYLISTPIFIRVFNDLLFQVIISTKISQVFENKLLFWYDLSMTTITISKKRVDKEAGVVILSLQEYRKLAERALPHYYTTGNAAKKFDASVEEGLRDYREGRTIRARSMSEALKLYAKKNKRN